MEQTFYALADLSAASVAAISGAQAARQRGLDLFGVYTVAHVTACSGGIFRDALHDGWHLPTPQPTDRRDG